MYAVKNSAINAVVINPSNYDDYGNRAVAYSSVAAPLHITQQPSHWRDDGEYYEAKTSHNR